MKNILPVILIIVSIAGFYLYIKPEYEAITALQVEQGQYKDAIAKSTELVNLYNELGQKYNNFPSADLKRLDTMIPNNPDNVRLVMDINNIGLTHGISIRSVKIQDGPNQGGNSFDASAPAPYRSTITSFTAKSAYTSLTDFIRDLEKSLRIMDIQSVTIVPITLADTGGVYNVTVSLRSYSVASQQ